MAELVLPLIIHLRLTQDSANVLILILILYVAGANIGYCRNGVVVTHAGYVFVAGTDPIRTSASGSFKSKLDFNVHVYLD